MNEIYNKALTAIKYETDSFYSEEDAIEFIQNVTFDVVVLKKDIDYFNRIEANLDEPQLVLCEIYKEAFRDVSPRIAINRIKSVVSRAF